MDFGLFGIGLPQILLIMLVALIVFGPDRLPVMARQVGRWVNDLRRMTQEARGEIQSLTKEIDIRDDLNSVKQDLLDIKNDLTLTGQGLVKDFDDIKQDIKKEVTLVDEQGNLMGQQREQYTYEVKDISESGDGSALAVEETVKRETIIQEAVENTPGAGSEVVVASSPDEVAAQVTTHLNGDSAEAVTLTPSHTNGTAYATVDANTWTSHNATTTSYSLNGNTPEDWKHELEALDERVETSRREIYARLDALEERFLARVEQLEQSLSNQYERASQ